MGKHVQVDVEEESHGHVMAWLEGLKYLLTTGGMKMVQDTLTAPPAAGTGRNRENSRRYSVMVSSSVICVRFVDATRMQAQLKPRAQESVAVRILSGGRIVGFWDETGRRDVLVFYKAGGKAGVLHWCQPGKREELPNQSIKLGAFACS